MTIRPMTSPPGPERTGAPQHALRPLVVDLDGTLLNTDLLLEAFFSLVAANPLAALRALGALAQGKAAFKARLAAESVIEIATLPVNAEVLAFIRERKALGHKVYLASASDRIHVEALATHLGLFDGVFYSDGSVNLGGARKAKVLCDAFGHKGFDYIGNAKVDVAVWRHSGEVLLANVSPGLSRSVQRWAPEARAVAAHRPSARDYAKALRLHQWLKNLLIFVPAIAAHLFGAPLLSALIAFFSFSLCASSVYLLNDLLDLKSDREHRTKSRRAFASGKIPLVQGIVLVPVLLAGAASLAALLPLRFAIVLAGYYVLTLAYSFWLKRQMLVDVVTLACLYGVRLLAGGAAVGVTLSPWLGALSVFLFLSLALIKRCTELGERQRAGRGDPPGRGYRLADLSALQSMAAASGYLSILVLALYFNSPAVVALYSWPNRMWLICVLALYWISRVLLLSHRGDMHDDPVVFAATDRVSLLTAVAVGAVVLISL